MYGRFIYFAAAALLGVLCSLKSFLLFILLLLFYLLLLSIYKQFSIPQISILLAFFLLFFVSAQFAVLHNRTMISPSSSHFYVEFIEAPKIDGDKLQIIAKDAATREKLLLRYKITSEKEKKLLEEGSYYGCLCKVSGELITPPEATNENAFNYRQYLFNQHIFWFLDSRTMPLENCTKQKLTLLMLLKQWRYEGINDLRRHFPLETAALAAALIYGETSLMSPDTLADYQNIGISHLLAISGLQVTLLVIMIFYLGIRMGRTREFMTNLLLGLLPGYAVITGGAPSVVRSVLMLFLVMSVVKWGRPVQLLPIDALSIAFLIYLFFNPYVVFDVGFQLSFIVCSAVILSSPSILNRYQNSIAQTAAVSLTSQLAALPVLLYYFFEIPFISIFANLIFIPLYSYLFLPGVYLLLVIRFTIGIVPNPIINLFTAFVDWSIYLSQVFSSGSIPKFTSGRPGVIFLAVYCAIVLAIFILWEKRFPKEWRGLLIVLVLVLFQIQAGWNRLNPVGEVSIIDVGQGDSIFIHLPQNQGNYLIDTGGILPFQADSWQQRTKTFDPGRKIVLPFLKGKGITKIDKLILTHGDLDHIGGAFALIEEIKIGEILLPSVKEPSEGEKAIVQSAHEKGIPIVYVSEGQQWRNGESRFLILSPKRNYEGERNRGSVAILASVGGLNWFFGGDLNQEGEEEIVKRYPNINIDVIKVGHHGSKTSSSPDFLNHYKPRAALISVGKKNRFGHPHQEVINLLRKSEAVIYRTDENGEITYRFFKGSGTFSTYLP